MLCVILFVLLCITYCNTRTVPKANFSVRNYTEMENIVPKATTIPPEIMANDSTHFQNRKHVKARWKQMISPLQNSVPAVPAHCRLEANNTMKASNMKENISYLDCFVAESNHLDFEDIKRWTQKFKSSNVHVHIRCENGGRLTLRQPIKAEALTSLIVRSCIILRYLDYDLTNETLQIPFMIQILEFHDNQMEQTFLEYIKMFEKNRDAILENYFCDIPPSLKRYVERNTSIIHVDEPNGIDLYLLYRSRIQYGSQQRQCIYENLIYYEMSFTQTSAYDSIEYFLVKAASMPELRTLNFTHSLLTLLPPKIFNPTWSGRFHSLKMIDLSHNRMDALPFGHLFNGNDNSITLDLSYNNVTSLSFKEINTLKSSYPNVVVKLYGNPFACTCDLKDTLEFVQSNIGPEFHEYSYIKNMECTKPLNLQGMRIGELNNKELCFGTEHRNVYMYLLISVLICGYVVILFCIKFKKELKILAHTRLRNVFKRSTVEDGKTFDAFVSYSSLDESWVLNMCKRLEDSPHHLHLCLHHKHFLPGACISDNIINSVENSRHTIVVLSKNFLQSEWCLLEFRKAFHQSLIERQRRLVIVMLENLSKTDELLLSTDMKFFLQTHTYLWVSEMLFWDKLIYSLSKKSELQNSDFARWISYEKDNKQLSDKLDMSKETVL